MERVMGIEPTPPAWEAGVLPLNYTRSKVYYITVHEGTQVEGNVSVRLIGV
jgi:hypothetical protein